MDIISDVFYYVNSFDIDYISWVLWVFYPILITFLLPAFIVIFLYLSALMLFIYKQRLKLKAAYDHDIWNGARQTLAVLWSAQAKTWHGYEVEGLQHIPERGPALIIYYHGVLPVDLYYVLTAVFLEKNRLIHLVGDKFLFHIPGWQTLMEVFNVTPGTVSSCIDVLKNGHLLSISPGGVREGLFGDENYSLIWNKRCGFAKVAIQANVPIIPMFTMNIREAFRAPGWARAWLRGFYEKTRLPLVPVYGLFPVKLKTVFGEPILPIPDSTPEDHAERKYKAHAKELFIPGVRQLVFESACNTSFTCIPHLYSEVGYRVSHPKTSENSRQYTKSTVAKNPIVSIKRNCCLNQQTYKKE